MKKAGFIALLGLFIIFFDTAWAADSPATTVAVMPFTNLMKNPDLDWLSEGIAETLTTKLGYVKSIRLVERLRIDKAINEIGLGQSGAIDEATAAKAGKLVGASTVVAGAYQKAGEKLRLTARFIAVSTGLVSNTAMTTGQLGDIFDLEDAIADNVLKTLQVTPTVTEKKKVLENPTTSLTAYENFSKGLNFMKEKNLDAAGDSFKKAAAADPNFTEAKENLAFVNWARPSMNASLYLQRVSKPYDVTFGAMVQAVQSLPSMSLRKVDKERGALLVYDNSWGLTKGPQDIEIELKRIKNMTGVRILSQPQKVPCLGIRPIFDWGASRKTIEQIIVAFEQRL